MNEHNEAKAEQSQAKSSGKGSHDFVGQRRGTDVPKSGMKAEMDESNRKWEEGQQAQRRFQEDGEA